MVKQKINGAQRSGVAFRARRASAFTTSAGSSNDIVYDQLQYEYSPSGSAYSTSTGLFTAPITGIYHFTANAWLETANTTRSFFTTRGTVTTGTNPNGTARTAERSIDGDVGAGRLYRSNGMFEIYMAAGETFGVSLYTSAADNINHPDTNFSGHLVQGV